MIHAKILRCAFPPERAKPKLLLLAIEDVTERRRADSAVKDSDLRHRRLFQTARDCILVLDADSGTISDANVLRGRRPEPPRINPLRHSGPK